MKVKVRKTYNDSMKGGQIVEVDKFRYNEDCASKIEFRVVGVWKQPKWFDSYWFMSFNQKS